jgi:hypothetical protein
MRQRLFGIKHKDNVNFNLVTSENWINNDDIISSEFEVLEEIDEED